MDFFLSFFDYLNKKTTKISLLEDSAKDEFGEMALFVNENIKQTRERVEDIFKGHSQSSLDQDANN